MLWLPISPLSHYSLLCPFKTQVATTLNHFPLPPPPPPKTHTLSKMFATQLPPTCFPFNCALFACEACYMLTEKHFFLFLFFFFLMPFSGVGFFLFTYGSFRHLVGLLGRGIRPVPRPLSTQDNTTQTHIHAPSRIRTCDPDVRAAEDTNCLRPRGHWDRP
jgi:hypothetical protein